MRAYNGLATIAAVLLAGCQTLNGITGASEPAQSSEPSAGEGTAPATMMSPPATGAALAGMSADNLRALWGEPTLKRSEGDAQMWQYGGSGCALLIYLYPGATALTVTHAEAVPGGPDAAAVEACAKASGKPSLKPVS
jgi:hypothetical protein